MAAIPMTGGQALVRSLYQEGVRVVFGLPGVQLYGVMAALREEPRIRFVNTRHEQATSFMADGYARAGGSFGTAQVVPGPGLLNAMSGLSTAYSASSPVLMISGHATIDTAVKALHQGAYDFLEKPLSLPRVLVTVQNALDHSRLARELRPDLVLLDLMLPDVSGTEVCKQLKENASTRGVPVMMLTAKGEEIDRVVGFELGADDYVVKPFSVRELLLRIQAILRRGRGETVEVDLPVDYSTARSTAERLFAEAVTPEENHP